jgi:drug/metabolite transporter (DMT)-like permease
METMPPRWPWKTILAFGVIYFVWGSTFLAIRIGVQEVPPFLFAAMRFLIAGSVLCVFVVFRGTSPPTRNQWLSALLLAFLIFVMDYGLLFWAERRIPSGIAAVLMATIPSFLSISEITLLGTQRLTMRLGAALLIGIAGVTVLMSHSFSLGGASIDRWGATAVIFASLSWSVSSVLTRKLPLPRSQMMSAGVQMLIGGTLLVLTAGVLGEFPNFHPWAISPKAWLSLLYLTFAGSILGFTVYLWLIHRESPTKVGTYAYVNPVIAVLVGYFLGGEDLGLRTVLGTFFVLASVVMITTQGKKPVRSSLADTGDASVAPE